MTCTDVQPEMDHSRRHGTCVRAHRLLAALMLAGLAMQCSLHAAELIHNAVGPRVLYPDSPNALLASVRRLFAEADPLSPNVRLLACMAPHSAFGLSGPIAALAFKELQPGQYDRVIVLAPAHYAEFEGCSIAAVEAYETPLGLVPVDLNAVQELTRHGLISSRALRYLPNSFLEREERDNLHEAEHSIEMVLPFLQVRLGPFLLIPILVGNLNDSNGKRNENIVEDVARFIKRQVTETTLIVVSTDLTHFGSKHGYRPFEENILARIDALDKRACELIQTRDFEGFAEYMDATDNTICGRTALEVFFKMLPPDARGLLLGRRKEADVTGNENFTVSYAAINFYDVTKPPLPARQIQPAPEPPKEASQISDGPEGSAP